MFKIFMFIVMLFYGEAALSYDVDISPNVTIKNGNFQIIHSGEIISLDEFNATSVGTIDSFIKKICESKISPEEIEVKIDIGVAKAKIKGAIKCDQ